MRVGLRSNRAPPAERLLPDDSPCVKEHLRKLRSKTPRPPAASRGCTWKTQHEGQMSVRMGQPVAGLSERAESLLGILLAQAGSHDLSPGWNVDVSQSLQFARLSECLPTVTPRSVIVIGQLRRTMLPIEKCLIHAVPVHEVTWPPDFGDADIADCGGNTMHLMAVVHAQRREG